MSDPADALFGRLFVEEPEGFDPEDLPSIAVSAPQGKFLALLTRAIGARRVLELGTLAGYSTIWFARGGAEVVTVELDPHNAEVAGRNLERAGVADAVTQHVGPALEVIPTLDGPFDLAFLDADKQTMADQLRGVLPLVRSGGVIICDNVVRGGGVVEPSDDRAEGARATLELLAADDRIDATAIQTVGDKGHDGFALGVVA